MTTTAFPPPITHQPTEFEALREMTERIAALRAEAHDLTEQRADLAAEMHAQGHHPATLAKACGMSQQALGFAIGIYKRWTPRR